MSNKLNGEPQGEEKQDMIGYENDVCDDDIITHMRLSCSGSSWWPSTFLRQFMLGFPLSPVSTYDGYVKAKL